MRMRHSLSYTAPDTGVREKKENTIHYDSMIDVPPVLRMRSFRVEEIRWETISIYTLIIVPETPEDMITFDAGQWVYLCLLNSDGSLSNRVAISIASAPEASRDRLEFGIKIYGDRTKRLSEFVPGDTLAIQGPFGLFMLPQHLEELVFFAGGIGVTPFRSMLHSLALRQCNVPTTLFYSNKALETTPYYEELDDLQRVWPAFHPVVTLTAEVPAKWTGERGRIGVDMVKRHLPDMKKPLYYMCGPETFMQDMQGILQTEGVDVKRRLKRESFG